jgi:protein involved in polysaccharide export with SLBB domain
LRAGWLETLPHVTTVNVLKFGEVDADTQIRTNLFRTSPWPCTQSMKHGMGTDNGASEPGSDPDLPPLRRLPQLRALLALLPFLVMLASSGCATTQSHVDKDLMAERGAAVRNEGIADRYGIGCPDVLELTVGGHPELSHRYTVAPDGRIELDNLGQPRVEGRTAPEVAQAVADTLRLPPEYVEAQVVEFKSQSLYLFGEVNGLQRSVPYRGHETVLDLLQRIGGITPGAAPEEVYVVRSRVSEGQRPEVFHVDLHAIVEKHDQKTNVRLEPFDQVHVGATRRARLEKCIPPWLRPIFHALCWRFPTPPGEDPERVRPTGADQVRN